MKFSSAGRRNHQGVEVLDLPRLVVLLGGNLLLTRSDLLQDEFEGSVTRRV
jgi:hypothetical protein